MNVLFVPSLGLDVSLLTRLAESVDYPVKYKVAWNNGPEGALDEFGENFPDWIVKDSPVGNRGVAGSWNECAKWFSSEPAWLLMNEDAWFYQGQLEQICNAADEHHHDWVIYLNKSEAYYCFVWTQAGVRDVGYFDENFWPAYYEDCDYRVRMRALGTRTHPYVFVDNDFAPHGKGRDGGTDYAALIQGTGLLNRAYWRRKWGSDNHEQATYTTPYKDQRLTVKDWVWYPEHRAKLYPLWDAFINGPKPSIYG